MTLFWHPAFVVGSPILVAVLTGSTLVWLVPIAWIVISFIMMGDYEGELRAAIHIIGRKFDVGGGILITKEVVQDFGFDDDNDSDGI